MSSTGPTSYVTCGRQQSVPLCEWPFARNDSAAEIDLFRSAGHALTLRLPAHLRRAAGRMITRAVVPQRAMSHRDEVTDSGNNGHILDRVEDRFTRKPGSCEVDIPIACGEERGWRLSPPCHESLVVTSDWSTWVSTPLSSPSSGRAWRPAFAGSPSRRRRGAATRTSYEKPGVTHRGEDPSDRSDHHCERPRPHVGSAPRGVPAFPPLGGPGLTAPPSAGTSGREHWWSR